jgi:WD40 repeat protein
MTIQRLPRDAIVVLLQNLPSVQTLLKTSQVSKFFHELIMGNSTLWRHFLERDFKSRALTYSVDPKDQYLERSGSLLFSRAKMKQVSLLTTFKDVHFPYKAMGHFVIGSLKGEVAAMNLHTHTVETCKGRLHPKVEITALDAIEDESGTIRVYSGSEDGSVEVWNLTNKKWEKWFSPYWFSSSVKQLQIYESSEMFIYLASNGVFIYTLAEEQRVGYRQQENASDHASPCDTGVVTASRTCIKWRRLSESSETQIEILDLFAEIPLLQTLSVSDTLFQIHATSALIVGYSQESQHFYVWG